MSRRDELNGYAARNGGWLRSTYTTSVTVLVYDWEEEELWTVDLSDVEAVGSLRRTGTTGHSPMQPVDRYGDNNKRGRSVKLWRWGRHGDEMRWMSQTLPADEVRMDVSSGSVALLMKAVSHAHVAEKRMESAWDEHIAAYASVDVDELTFHELLEPWGWKRAGTYRTYLRIGEAEVPQYHVESVMVGLGLVDEADVLEIKGRGASTQLRRCARAGKWDYPIYRKEELGFGPEILREHGDLVYSGFVNTAV